MLDEKKEFKYDAFISYRHAELDKFVAENLHTRLENFRLPRNVQKKGVSTRTRIERVFRDREELPLTTDLEETIVTALGQSEYLIVICSPRLKESEWCKKEIETFVRLRGRNKIMAVLVEGEPGESFPDELMFREETVTREDGRIELEKVRVDTLAADVRGVNKKEIMKALDTESLRLMAPMYGVDFDDLKQRHKERQFHRMIVRISFLAAIFLIVAIGSFLFSFAIVKQKDEIERQSIAIRTQAEEIDKQSKEIEAQNASLVAMQARTLTETSLRLYDEDRRWEAVDYAVKAMTSYEGIALPYTAEAQYALSKALHVYDSGYSLRASWQIDTDAQAEMMLTSESKKYLAIFDKAKNLYIWDTVGKNLLFKTKTYASVSGEKAFGFVKDELFVYVEEGGNYAYFDLQSGERVITSEKGKTDFSIDDISKKIYANEFFGEISCFDLETQSFIKKEPEAGCGGHMFCCPEAGCVIYGGNQNDSGYICVMDAASMETKYIYPISPGESIYEVVPMGNIAYVITWDTNDLLHTNSVVYKFDLQNGEMLWRTAVEDTLVRDLLPGGDDQVVFFVNYDGACQVDAMTGDVLNELICEGEIVGKTATNSNDAFFAFSALGERVYLNFAAGWAVVDVSNFIYKASRPEQIELTANYYAVIPRQENRVIMYNYEMDNDFEETTETFVEAQTECIKYAQAMEEARKYNLPDAEQVNTVFYSDDQKLMFVDYIRDQMEVYEIRGGKASYLAVVDTSDISSDLTTYLGKDDMGNIYIGSIMDGLCLNSNYERIAFLGKVVAVCGDHLIFENRAGTKYFAAPVYSKDDLLEIAETYGYVGE